MSLTAPGSVAMILSTCPLAMSFNTFLALRTGSGHDSPLVSSSLSNFTRFLPELQLPRPGNIRCADYSGRLSPVSVLFSHDAQLSPVRLRLCAAARAHRAD